MLVYVSGPYRGDVDENITRAAAAAIQVWEAGHAAICPHLNTAYFDDYCRLGEDDYLRGDLEILSRCDAILMIPGWEESEGARAELEFARRQGLLVYHWPELPPAVDEPVRRRYPFREFCAGVARRLARGAIEYGGDSYLDDDVLRQVEEELMDVAGWASLQWAKVRRLRETVQEYADPAVGGTDCGED